MAAGRFGLLHGGRYLKEIYAVLYLLAAIALSIVFLGCNPYELQYTQDEHSIFSKDRISTVRIKISDADWANMKSDPMKKRYVPADFEFEGSVLRHVAVRTKGNSSLRASADLGIPWFSLTVDLNLFNVNRNFQGQKKINFNTGFKYHFLLRARLAAELFEEMGVPVPRTAYTNLWVNDTHLGAYAIVEQVDKVFLMRHFPRNDGNLYKPLGLSGSLNWTESDINNLGQRGYSPMEVNLGGGRIGDLLAVKTVMKSKNHSFADELPIRDHIYMAGLKTNENHPDHSALFRFLEVINGEPGSTFTQDIEKVLDVDRTLRFLAVSTMMVNLDSYLGSGQNYYLYEIDGRFTIIPWDLNEAFGVFHCGLERNNLINFYVDEPTAGSMSGRPLIAKLLSHDPYLEIYHRYLWEMLGGPFNPDNIDTRVDQLAGLVAKISQNVQDVEIRRVSEMDYDLEASPYKDPPSVVELKTFLSKRADSVHNQLLGKLPRSANGNGNGAVSAMCL